MFGNYSYSSKTCIMVMYYRLSVPPLSSRGGQITQYIVVITDLHGITIILGSGGGGGVLAYFLFLGSCLAHLKYIGSI